MARFDCKTDTSVQLSLRRIENIVHPMTFRHADVQSIRRSLSTLARFWVSRAKLMLIAHLGPRYFAAAKSQPKWQAEWSRNKRAVLWTAAFVSIFVLIWMLFTTRSFVDSSIIVHSGHTAFLSTWAWGSVGGYCAFPSVATSYKHVSGWWH